MCTNNHNFSFWNTLNRIMLSVDIFVKKCIDKIDENVNNLSPSFIRPKYDVVEFDDSYYVRIEVSGMDENSLFSDIKENNRSLCLYMKKKRPVDVDSHEIIYSNRSYGMCRLYIKLPNTVEYNEQMMPDYRNGILTLIFYKKNSTYHSQIHDEAIYDDNDVVNGGDIGYGDGGEEIKLLSNEDDNSFEIYIDQRENTDDKEEL